MDEKERTVIVVAEQNSGVPAGITFEMIDLAKRLGAFLSLTLRVVVLGDGSTQAARNLAGKTGVQATAVVNPHLGLYNGEIYRSILGDLIDAWGPEIVLVAHTTQGLDFGPGLAVRLQAACISGVERYGATEEGLHFWRTVSGGKIETRVTSKAARTLITIQPGAFPVHEEQPDFPDPPTVEVIQSNYQPQRSRTLGVRQTREADAAISQAETIVAAGRGIGKKENLELIKMLAQLFPRSAVAGSRPVCDAGWLEYSRQVGLTGTTVSPKLYIACGISGARQHTVGMQGSGFIVAISTDPHAAIFNLADVVINEDLTVFIPVLIDTCRQSG